MATIPQTALVLRAEGPVAKVYLVATGGRTTVVKVYPRPLDRRTVTQLKAEQARLAALRTVSSILLVEGLDELPDGSSGLRMEFCPRSLPDLVAGGPAPIGELIALGRTLAAVLAEAHGAGLVHGGVTPSNVLLRPSGQLALSDFGTTLRLQFPRQTMVDAAYTAPEVLRESDLTPPADVYGLGTVLYLALTGRSPFPARTGESMDAVVLRVLREVPPDVSGRDVPDRLTDLLGRMLAKEPGARPSAAEVVAELSDLPVAPADEGDELDFDDFHEELAAARTVTSLHERRPVVRPRPNKKTRRRTPISKGAVIGAVAAVSLLALIPVMLQPGKDGPSPQTGETVTTVETVETMAPSNTSVPSAAPTGRSTDKPTAGPTTAPPPTVPPPTAPPPTAPPPAAAVKLELQPPQDKGSSVVLRWTSTKPLEYAVFVAEQGGKSAQTSYRGRGTSLTVPVTPGLMYCFQVQGTDGTAGYESEPRPIRGATCSG